MSENTATITYSQEHQNGSGRRSIFGALFYLYLKIMLYIVVFSIPFLILKRSEYDGSVYKSMYMLFAYCGAMIFAVLEAKEKLAVTQVIKAIRLDCITLKFIGIPVAAAVLALTVIIDQSNAFIDPPKFPLLQKDVYNLFLAVVAAPFLEEILCRGIVLKYLLTKTKPWMAILYSSLFFSALHMNLYQGIPSFFAGLFLGWIYYRSKSIWPGVLAHGINNALSFGCFFYFSGEDQGYLDVLGTQWYITLLVISILAFVLSCIVIQRKTSGSLPLTAF
jgi:membrane protease YdiL (CAAX protease family)